ncbi:hypothetical protein [Aquihabitans sp. McL0605]|uniref:hypothetical protein n=1 Tax=Aquihabitans sp. McL0605 TaxID=3415671 RepID=UPI003CFA827B
MGQWGRRARVLTTVVLVAVTLMGSAKGLDDDFPIGPFRMYAQARSLNSPVNDTWPWAIDAAGHDFRLSQAKLGVRRAEIEGQLGTFQHDPERLEILADAYAERHPGAPPIKVVEIRTRKIAMHDGKPTGHEWVLVRARWKQ